MSVDVTLLEPKEMKLSQSEGKTEDLLKYGYLSL